MARLSDWQSRFQALLAERRAREFEWGQHDCCLFACDAVRVVTGRDPGGDLRGYTTERAAMRLVKRLGGIRAIAAARAGAEILPAQAQVADVGLVSLDDRESLAVCGGAHWLAPGPYGLEPLPRSAVLTAWRCE